MNTTLLRIMIGLHVTFSLIFAQEKWESCILSGLSCNGHSLRSYLEKKETILSLQAIESLKKKNDIFLFKDCIYYLQFRQNKDEHILPSLLPCFFTSNYWAQEENRRRLWPHVTRQPHLLNKALFVLNMRVPDKKEIQALSHIIQGLRCAKQDINKNYESDSFFIDKKLFVPENIHNENQVIRINLLRVIAKHISPELKTNYWINACKPVIHFDFFNQTMLSSYRTMFTKVLCAFHVLKKEKKLVIDKKLIISHILLDLFKDEINSFKVHYNNVCNTLTQSIRGATIDDKDQQSFLKNIDTWLAQEKLESFNKLNTWSLCQELFAYKPSSYKDHTQTIEKNSK